MKSISVYLMSIQIFIAVIRVCGIVNVLESEDIRFIIVVMLCY